MTKEQILQYAINPPVNRAVLSGMLDSFASSDNKEEIELTVTENGVVYTPDEGKVYSKVTVDIATDESES